MNKRKKANLIGNVAIVCGAIAWFLSLIDLTLHDNLISSFVLILMIVYIATRDRYLEIRKEEIDEKLENERKK